MNASRGQLITWIEQGAIPPDRIDKALKVAGVIPTPKAWRRFVEDLLLWGGGLALSFSLVFFIAYNWARIGHWLKFGLVEALLALTIYVYCRWREPPAVGKLSLLAASICLGVLLALFGQVYQTGADPWQLFFSWALLMLPWTLIARFPVLWLLWLLLLNIAACLYHQALWWGNGWGHYGSAGFLQAAFFINTAALVAWEFLAQRLAWLSGRWAVRLLATVGCLALTLLVLHDWFTRDHIAQVALILWGGWLAAVYYHYRRRQPDLFMLVLFCLSLLVVGIAFVGEFILHWLSFEGLLLFAMAVLAMCAAAVYWLNHVHKEIRS